MEILAKNIAKNIARSLDYDSEKEQVIAYGMTAIIQTLTTTFLVIIFGLIFKVMTEALIIVFSVSILRKYSGGTHAASIEICTTTAVIYSIGCALISKYILAHLLTNAVLIPIAIIIFLLSYWIIYRRAPVDSPNKPIKTSRKIKRMRKGSFTVLTIYFILVVLFMILSQSNHIWINYIISLLFGIVWQITTLTRLSYALIYPNKHTNN